MVKHPVDGCGKIEKHSILGLTNPGTCFESPSGEVKLTSETSISDDNEDDDQEVLLCSDCLSVSSKPMMKIKAAVIHSKVHF
jgi:hypothetical protein